jgi:hypothetical protein
MIRLDISTIPLGRSNSPTHSQFLIFCPRLFSTSLSCHLSVSISLSLILPLYLPFCPYLLLHLHLPRLTKGMDMNAMEADPNAPMQTLKAKQEQERKDRKVKPTRGGGGGFGVRF